MKWENVNKYKLSAEIEPTNDYEKARKMLYETDIAIGKLTQVDRDKLLMEFLQFKGMYRLFHEIQRSLGR